MQRSGGGGDEARGEDPRGPGHPREGGQPAEAGQPELRLRVEEWNILS